MILNHVLDYRQVQPFQASAPAKESVKRSLAKTASWRAIGTLDTILISWLITGALTFALSIGVIELFTKMVLYFFHERLWNQFSYGKANRRNLKITQKNIAEYNKMLSKKTPDEVVQWALQYAQQPIVTSNFGPHSASMLNLVAQQKKDIKVIWCDTGYNTSYTYRHIEEICDRLNLNLFTYSPKQTSSQRDILFGGIPTVDDPNHKLFTEQVKLEPFKRALKEHEPDVWFTNIRRGQTAFRDTLNILSLSKDGILKVSPFYYWSDEQLTEYLEENNLPNETRYFDPTKVLQNRECGLHI